MKYLTLLGPIFWTFLVAFLASLILNAAIAETPPNIIVVVSDDQGFGELSCHGNSVVRTPHLDRLSQESIRFTDFHVAPMCTPTRGQLMTGCDAVRNGALNVSSGRTLLRTDFTTLPEFLKRGGYETGLFGKWHLGENFPYRPQDRGFDEVVTFPSSHIGSVPDFWLNDYFDDTYLHNGVREKYEGYTTDVFFDEAIQWMHSKHKSKQAFFAYVATAAPHSPHYVPEKYRQAAAARLQAALPTLPALTAEQQRSIARYLGMIENFDENIGKLCQFLETEQLRDNTVVVFLSDNGTTFGDIYYPAGMRGKKTTLFEGGHRVPLFIRWPKGNLGLPRELTHLTQVQDILPTLLEFAHIEKPDWPWLDGWSLAPLMRGIITTLPDRALFINYSRMPIMQNANDGKDPASICEVHPEGAAVLWNQWRLLENNALYNLESDPMQTRDVAADFPDIVDKLQTRLDQWWKRSGGKANQPQAVTIGDANENPSMLTACDWWNVFVDQQSQVRRGELKRGFWHLEVAKSGEYEIELRRWPREADLPLRAASPAMQLTDGEVGPGAAIPIAQAELRFGNEVLHQELAIEAKHAIFRVHMNAGPTKLESCFLDAEGKPLLGAYYAYVSLK